MSNRNSITTEEFVSLDALERIRLIDKIYGKKAIQLSSMQETGCVLMHMIYRVQARITILFIDTQYHFRETLEVRDQFIERYGLAIKTVRPELTPEAQQRKFGTELYKYLEGQPICCYLRKELPFIMAQRELQAEALILGLMRLEGGTRKMIKPIGHDPRVDGPVFHPLYDWNYDQLAAYTREYDLPIHTLYAKSYTSIGCAPCTTPVRPGEDRRAGRWRHLRPAQGRQPSYCKINFTDMDQGAGI